MEHDRQNGKCPAYIGIFYMGICKPPKTQDPLGKVGIKAFRGPGDKNLNEAPTQK